MPHLQSSPLTPYSLLHFCLIHVHKMSYSIMLFSYTPFHVHVLVLVLVFLLSYMLLELLKNSMRATVELHGVDNMPPIRIIIADGEDNEDVRSYL